ncbi:hypothetical protein P43SY_000781 [Pythium insidiosum]|uniref:Ribosomal RNA processing protein 1 n=1 Tax=Pythium insidiosum TaxID=114742 RepID=A0AAD5Q9D4_PYTIN|nr:hypothetical protein P43SY_000781 [Pythium insidiosum]
MENAASRFGQRLAHTEKKYRDQALKKLTLFLTKRTEWTDLDWDKLWKALFYCMWMSDKRPIQEELSTNLSLLVHKIPSVDLSLAFVHSFLRTMQREWHGIDGLRLDKFYSLVRKFVHQTFVLLQTHEWDSEHVARVVAMLSSEVTTRVPNGLRLHVTDLFLTELHGAAGETVDSVSFMQLLEPFFSLLSTESDKPLQKRVREMIFLPLLSTYKFGPQPPAKKSKKAKTEDGETDAESDAEEDAPKVFEEVELAAVQHRLFNLASANDTVERNRSMLYDLYSEFFKVTKVDSLKAAQEGTDKPTRKSTEKKKSKVEAQKEDAKATEAEDASAQKKKNKKRKKSKATEDEDSSAATEQSTPEKKLKVEKTASPVVTKTPANTPVKKEEESTPKKKQNKQAEKAVTEVAKTVKETIKSEPEKSPKKAKKADEKVAKKTEKVAVEIKKDAAKAEPAKKLKNEEKAAKTDEKAKKTKEAAEPEAKKTKKAATDKAQEKTQTIVRSGVKFRRCGSCGGFGKGLVPVGKDFCRHCERTGQAQKKAHAAEKKKNKRKAEAMAAAEEAAQPSKKVTFGKNKALPHELSVKRLKASAKKESPPKEAVKGVLKATSPAQSTPIKKSAPKGRKKAADFF